MLPGYVQKPTRHAIKQHVCQTAAIAARGALFSQKYTTATATTTTTIDFGV